ncbi:GNAT family N-acetyltransferase [Cohnella herbarum]|uniref:GNAT family N-acetyltransferase n=2 Tax=Cohnella herbarum TaxID=2728023 RepID=A0A7Z2VR86_9BACL|nr:GNAT family N-acetyltransferase [Cohnella herbarum]
MLTPSDMESVFQIYEITIPDAFEKDGFGLLIDDIQNEIENKKQVLQASLDQPEPDIFFMCAKRNEEVIGVISFGPCGDDIRACTNHQLDDVGELGSLYVLPSYQGQGVGSALIKAMVTYLEKQGIDRFCLDSGYKDAQKRWLRKFGVPYRVAQNYWGEDTAHMVWLCKVTDFCD